jgi:hypothetical protein
VQRVLVVGLAGVVALNVYLWNRTGEPDPKMMALAVRATVYAMPTPTPWIIEVTRIVELTTVVEVMAPVTPTPPPTQTLTPTVAPTPTAEEPVRAAEEAVRTASALLAAQAPAPAAQGKTESSSPAGCPTNSTNQYVAVPVAGGSADHPDTLHADLNLALRGYVAVRAALGLIEINGPTDGDPPQLAAIFADRRLPAFVAAYRVRDWNWGCGGHGCAGGEVDNVEVSFIRMQTQPGEPVRLPGRGAEVYGGGFKALVLYAEPIRITLSYTRDDTVAHGYVVHLEDLCVDPNLVMLYRHSNGAGRGTLPALREGEVLGVAAGALGVAVRDRGTFADPRSHKDWWRDK